MCSAIVNYIAVTMYLRLKHGRDATSNLDMAKSVIRDTAALSLRVGRLIDRMRTPPSSLVRPRPAEA